MRGGKLAKKNVRPLSNHQKRTTRMPPVFFGALDEPPAVTRAVLVGVCDVVEAEIGFIVSSVVVTTVKALLGICWSNGWTGGGGLRFLMLILA